MPVRATRILIADDHEVMRRGVRSLLEAKPEWEICGEAADGREAVAQVVALKPDLVVLDLTMPVLNGLHAAKEIRRISPGTKIVIFTLHDSAHVATEARGAGADAVVVKSAPAERLVETIERLVAQPAFDEVSVVRTGTRQNSR